MDLEVIDLGRMAFKPAWQLQRRFTDEVADGGAEKLLLVEHDDVVTLGRGADPANVLTQAFPVFEIERGGDATYHGPGQLVAYPILQLAQRGLGIHSYLRLLERLVIDALARLGVAAATRPRATGVWVDSRKIASIGIAVRRGVSYHGVALNVSTHLDRFSCINPCGFDASVMTSVVHETGSDTELSSAKSALLASLDAIALRGVSTPVAGSL